MKLLLSIFLMLFLTSISVSQSLENLGRNVNSEAIELKPVISPDGKTLYFIRHFESGRKVTQETWYSRLGNNGMWSPAQRLRDFDSPDLTSVNVFSISPDGNTMILGLYFTNNVSHKNGFYRAQKTSTRWSSPEKLKIDNYDKYSGRYWKTLCISNSGKVMLMSFSKSSYKNDLYSEIYISFAKGDNNWTEPRKLGSALNGNIGTHGSFAPFLASDDVTLYFAMDKIGGYGSADIYMSKRLDDTWLNWSKPVNLGPSINSKEWDAYYSISAKGDYAYLVSDKNSFGGSDIFRIKLPEEVRPNPVVLLSGKVIEPGSNKPLNAEISYFTLPEGTEAGTARTNPADGSYKIVLPYGKKYSCIAKVDGYYSISNYIDLTEVGEYKEMDMNLEMKPIIVGETFRLNNIFFDFNEATLRPESTQELDRVVSLLKDNSSIEIELSGHTDAIGTDEYNLSLSQRRADAVTSYLVTKGISTGRIISKGYGKRNPVATNDTDEGRQLNRRVEFKILKK